MDQWELLVQEYSKSANGFRKALQTAEAVFKEDLAGFEIEWIVQTLLCEPVCLLKIVCSEQDESWRSCIVASFKLLAEVLPKCEDFGDHLFQDVLNVCLMQYDAMIRTNAINCMRALCKMSPVVAGQAEKFIAELESASICRAPLAMLIGTLCEYHPAYLSNEYNKIWRLFLNLLENNKKTDTVTSAYLQGILGLFKYYGSQLPMVELAQFYQDLVGYLDMTKCKEVVLAILEEHTDLFLESLAEDPTLRMKLWAHVPTGTDAVLKVYRLIFELMKDDLKRIENVLQAEVAPRLHVPETRYVALRVWSVYTLLGGAAPIQHEDVLQVECSLRAGDHVASQVSYCIDAALPNSDRLLQAAILNFHSLPAKKIKEIIVYPLARAPDQIRKASINLLITESCVDGASFDRYLPLWRQLLDSDGQDPRAVEGSRHVFNDFMDYVLWVVETFLDDYSESLPEQLQFLFKLVSLVLSFQSPEGYTRDACAAALPLLRETMRRCQPQACTVAAGRHLLRHAAGLDLDYEMLSLDSCADEALLCECCLAFIQSPDDLGDVRNILTSLQIIFSRSDVEVDSYLTALKKCQHLLMKDIDLLNSKETSKVIAGIEDLYNRKDLTGKEARNLKREIFFFLGKFGNVSESSASEASSVLLKDNLTLDLKYLDEGVTYKIKLDEMLEHAIRSGDPDILRTLLTVICAGNPVRQAERACRVCAAWCHASVASAAADALPVLQALKLSNVTVELLPYIACERSPGVRGLLSDVLERLLSDPRHQQAVEPVAAQALLMLRDKNALTRQAGLDVSLAVLRAADPTHAPLRAALPALLPGMCGAVGGGPALLAATHAFVRAAAMYDPATTVGMIQEMMRHLTHPKSDVDFARHETTVRTAVDFIKVVASEKKLDSAIFLGIDAASVARKMVLLCELKSAFRFESDFDLRLLEGNGLLDLEVEDLEDPFSVAATLRVLTDFAGTYMEIRREKSVELLAGLVEKLKPNLIITVNRSIVNCLQTYKDLLGELPPLLTNAFDVWFSVLPINEITTSLEENKLLDEHKAVIKSLNIMLMVFELRSDLIKTWPDSIMKVTPKKSDLEYISSALSASLKASSRDDIKRLISGGDGRDLCRRHVKVFFGFLVKSPSVLLDGDVTSAYSLLDDVVDCYVRMRCPERWRGDVLNLVDGLWPVYEQQTEFSKKQALLVSLSRFPVPPPPTSPPVAWGVKTLMEGEITQRICLVGALPAGEEYSAAYSSFSGVVGPRLREAARGRGPALRALLGAAHCGDPTLLRTVAALAAGDDTKGWWDEAIDSCMAAVAKHRDVTVHETIYAWTWTGLSTGVCERMLVPLLRHTPAKRLEEFLSNKVNMLIDMLMTGRAASNALAYEQGVVNYTRALSVLAVAFEKLPRQSLEASSSVLHSRMASPESWMLVRRACKLCVTLRDAVTCPEGAGGGLRGACRAFYVAAYKCLTAALCRWKQPKAYVTLFDEKALSNLMDPEKRYELPIKPKWSRRCVRRQVPADTGAAPAAASSGGSVRTRPLLRTLSDNPLHFDLLEPHECEEVTTEEWRVDHTELNGLEACLSVSRALALAAPCAAALRRAAAALCDTAALCGAAAAQSHVAALLAQAVCNSASDLQHNCEILIPALLKYVTAVEDGAALNGLQVDVLNTISGWGGGGARREGADAAVRLLVRTCLQHQRRRPLLDAVADCLDGFLRAHPGTITVRYDAFPDYSADSTSDETKLCMLRILQIITKHNIYVERLLPTVLAVLADARRQHPVQKLAELFGQTLAVCDDETVARESLASYQRVLETYLKTNVSDYVRLLYYAQLGCPRCCSFKSFKTVLSKASRLPKAEKLRCLRVIAKYLEHGPGNDDVIRDVVSTLNFEGLLGGDCVKEALGVIRSGLQRYGNTEVLRSAVMLAVKLCDHPAADVRNAAGDVAKKAFEKLCEDHEQSAPKRQRSSLTPVLRVAQGADRYTGSLLRGLGQGLTGDIQGLSTTSFHARFTECFYLAICLPILHSKTPPDVTSAVWNMTRMLFAAAKGQDGLARARLRDEPLDLGAPTAAPSPLTAAPAHLGTFRSAACLTRLHTARPGSFRSRVRTRSGRADHNCRSLGRGVAVLKDEHKIFNSTLGAALYRAQP
uniref:DNA-dependent protein kinase catalytic subunit CC3 domain-containing protein n=1 Tax=Bombyx mori TaxID=7091 RepID=A0A8R2M775_BOMMO|nr:uncharacterized protein LOC105841651 isoform X2 [Bombyx mori]